MAVGDGFSIDFSGVNQASLSMGSAVSAGTGVTGDLTSQVLNESACAEIGSSVAAANSSMQDGLDRGLNQTMGLLDSLNTNVQSCATGYGAADSTIADGFNALGSGGNPAPVLVADAGPGLAADGQGGTPGTVLAPDGSGGTPGAVVTAQADVPTATDAPPAVPPQGTAPADVRDWWNGLSQDQQQQVLSSNPAALGTLDGMPIGLRSTINQGLLGDQIQQTQDQITALQNNPPVPTGDPGADMGAIVYQQGQISQLETKLGGLQEVQTLTQQYPNLYLLSADTEGPGHVVISINDPSTANYVATVVPGTETNLNAGSVLANVTTADRLGASAIAAGAAPGQTAVVTWMNYDAPQSIGQAVANQLTGNGSTAAIQAAPAFAQFQNGLAALNPNATTTVIGDSYGSLVVGQAALVPGGFPATNVVAVASPGMDVQDASAFGGSQVFAARDTNDPIYWADMTGLHGTDPVSPSFHATVFDAGDGPTDWGLAHTYYFSPGSPGMVNMGLIIAGQGQNVTLQPR